MTVESLLVWTLVITIPALWLWDKACERFWRWWHRRHGFCWLWLHDWDCVFIHDSGSPAVFRCKRCGLQELQP